jgi:hypothetical protein
MEDRSVRELRQREISLIERLLDRDVAGAEELRSQLSSCLVNPINEDETILRFHTPPCAVPAVLPYKQNVAVEASAKDADGCRVEVLLHVKDGRLYELEYVKTDGSPLQSKPTAENLSDFIVH